jgi:hypothetical protein
MVRHREQDEACEPGAEHFVDLERSSLAIADSFRHISGIERCSGAGAGAGETRDRLRRISAASGVVGCPGGKSGLPLVPVASVGEGGLE